ncbi:MAG TPA: hypothetical protein VHZ55_24975 [Bryobacteraceae bacterium]|jgi:hypothetical protein|nr:hypothetical protein [Bryobacteraceae bacterium]
MLWIDQSQFNTWRTTLQNVPHRNPKYARGFQCNVIHLMLFQPLAQSFQIRGERPECSRFFAGLIPVADPDAGTYTLLVHVQTGTPTV